MKKVAFVTGAAGFLGRHLLGALCEGNWQVHVLLRHTAPEWMGEWPDLVISTGALEDANSVLSVLPEQCDAVFHLAGDTSSWRGDEKAIYRDNVVATENVIGAAQKKNVGRLIATSTLGIFDNGGEVITEHTPRLELNSRNPYLRTKRLADALLDEARQQGLSVVSLYPGHILGKYDRTGWVGLFSQANAGKLRLAPGGKASFCLARDVARAHVQAAVLPVASPRYVIASADATYLQLFNGVATRMGLDPAKSTASSGVIKLVAALGGWMADITGHPPVITPGLADILTSELIGSAELARQDLGLPRTTLDAMLDETYADWLSYGKPGQRNV